MSEVNYLEISIVSHNFVAGHQSSNRITITNLITNAYDITFIKKKQQQKGRNPCLNCI